MKLTVVACELPHPEGTAAGRDLWAWCEGMRARGHDLEARVWSVSPSSPTGPIPEWCRRCRIEDVAPADDSIVVADHSPSYRVWDGRMPDVATLHLRTFSDVIASRRAHPTDWRVASNERFARRHARLVLAYSGRVARGARVPVRTVPIAYPVTDEMASHPDEPVAALMADWWWPPNKVALRRLLGIWPDIRHAVPGARLLLAGRHLEDVGVGSTPGVELVGDTRSSADVLCRAAAVLFPCPASSGPKVKVLEALAFGIPVVTTRWGAEGLCVGPGEGVVIARVRDFAAEAAALLTDPARREAVGRAGLNAVRRNHSGSASARAREAAIMDVLG